MADVEIDESEVSRPYLLKAGKNHSAVVQGERVEYEVGQKVYLTDAQYASFADKFTPAEDEPASPSTPSPTPAPAQPKPAASPAGLEPKPAE